MASAGYVRNTGTVKGIDGSAIDVGVDYGAVTLLTSRDAVRLDATKWQEFLIEFFVAVVAATVHTAAEGAPQVRLRLTGQTIFGLRWIYRRADAYTAVRRYLTEDQP